jgi:hypothetical protein
MREQPRTGIGCIAFAGDSLVPVVERRGGVFDLDSTQPGILAGRLVEVSVNANISRIAHTLKFFSIGWGDGAVANPWKRSKSRMKITNRIKIKSTMKIKSKNGHAMRRNRS